MSENDKNESGEKRPLDLVGSIIRFEAGEMDDDETIEFAQQLWDSGLWRQLQGSYHRFIQHMIDAGNINTGNNS